MPRLYNLPRGYPRHFRGRRFNRLSGSYAPRTYGNFGMARRATHIRGGHQATPYGAGGGGRRQIHGTYSGPNAIFASARGAAMHGGHNLGLTAHTPGYRGTRVASGFRKDQASIKRYFNKEILAKRRELRRAPAANKNRLRHEIQQLGMKHRSERRAHAQGLKTDFLKTHSFKGGGGSGRQWTGRLRGGGNRIYSPRFGINVGQDSRSGRRYIQGLNFRRQQGGGAAGWARRYGSAKKGVGPEGTRYGRIQGNRVVGGSRAQRIHDWRWKPPAGKPQIDSAASPQQIDSAARPQQSASAASTQQIDSAVRPQQSAEAELYHSNAFPSPWGSIQGDPARQRPGKAATDATVVPKGGGVLARLQKWDRAGRPTPFDPTWRAPYQQHQRILHKADFTRGGRRRGAITGGDLLDTGRYGGQVMSPIVRDRRLQGIRRRPMTTQERWFASGRHAPHARNYMRNLPPGRNVRTWGEHFRNNPQLGLSDYYRGRFGDEYPNQRAPWKPF